MCGFVTIAGRPACLESLKEALETLGHRGPDAEGVWISPANEYAMGHKRLKVIDLTNAAHQPMSDNTGRYKVVFNGEVYNYLELKEELRPVYEFRTKSDTEVLLAAYKKWKDNCLDKFIGMFAFSLWDEKQKSLFAGRDRFGVKPLYYAALPEGGIALASEIKALHALGIPAEPDGTTWAAYLAHGLYGHNGSTFWKGIKALPPGCALRWKKGSLRIWKWYDLAKSSGMKLDRRPEEEVMEEYKNLLKESVRLRFRSDVPVGVNLSGGLDSSILLEFVRIVKGADSGISAFTFITGDGRYDECAYVKSLPCLLEAKEVPSLASKVQCYQDEPFGGLPVLAYAKVFEAARRHGVIVLLDGQGLDEQWAGYDYYAALDVNALQGTKDKPARPDALIPEFRSQAQPFFAPSPFPDDMRNLQYREAQYTKIPRNMRFNDRISMMHSTELREPFLDHRLFELALRQPQDRKLRGSTHKWMVRRMTQGFLPDAVAQAPKRPLQTPQREWLRGPLREWADSLIEDALSRLGGVWLDTKRVREGWNLFQKKEQENSFYVWQWINIGLMSPYL